MKVTAVIQLELELEPRGDTHGHELLEQQLGGIWQLHSNDAGRALAGLAVERVLPQGGHGDDAALLAHVDPIRVTLVVQSLLQECCGAVRDDAVALHLSETQATIPGPTLCGLPCQDLYRSPAPAMDLVIHHMLEPLVVRRVQEDQRLELPTRVAIVHDLPAAALVATAVQGPGDVVNSDAGERRRVSLLANAGSYLAH